MQIIVLINDDFDSFSNDIPQDNKTHYLWSLLKDKYSRSLNITESPSIWESIYSFFNMPADFSPAKYLATKNDIPAKHFLMATPVRVQLGLRHAKTYFLNEKSVPTKDQVRKFNEYFEGEYCLYPTIDKQFLLCSNNSLELYLEKHYWPPTIADFSLQMMTSNSELRKFHTDVQTWCHDINYLTNPDWNGLYLWGQGQSITLPDIEVATENVNESFFRFLHSSNESTKKIVQINNNSLDNQYLDECIRIISTKPESEFQFIFNNGITIQLDKRKKTKLWSLFK